MQKKRIAIFGIKYFPSKGGTSRVVENLLHELKEHYDFTIYCYQHEAASTHIAGVETIQFPEIPIKGFGVFLYYIRCCWHLLTSGHYDLVHLHKTDGSFFLPFLCLKYKVIATAHALPHLNEKWSALGRLYFRLTEKLFIYSGATLTAIAKPQRDYFFQKYKKEVQFIPNGIHAVKNVQVELADDILKKFNIQEDYLFFAARRVIPLKGCHTLLKALQQIQYKGSVVIAGDLDQVPAYTKKLKELGKGLDVKFIGYVAGMGPLNALLKRAKFFVFPSELEGMSMMLLEAGSIGTPMICSDIPQNLAVLSDQEVLYFKSKDVNDLAHKLIWALQNTKAMSGLAKQTKQTVERDYLVSKVVQQYMNLYNQVIASGKLIPNTKRV